MLSIHYNDDIIITKLVNSQDAKVAIELDYRERPMILVTESILDALLFME